MNKIMTKTLSVMICIAFTGLQMSMASVLTTGTYAGTDVLGGTGANISGHNAGLTGVTTNGTTATLNFGGNARIDWTKLNVDHGQTLNFANGNFGVLNNVVGGSISKFAGTINAQNGKVIISNPNGILFQGGKFESLGGLVLTTKNLQNLNVTDSTDFDSINPASYSNGSGMGVVSIIESSDISAANINIIANGVEVDSSTLASTNANGFVFITGDGANFAATRNLTLDDSSVARSVDFSDNSTVKVANSALTTSGGTVSLVSDRHLTVDKANIKGDAVAQSKRGHVYFTNGGAVDGDLRTKAAYDAYLNKAVTEDKLIVNGDLTMENGRSSYGYNVQVNGETVATGPNNIQFYSTTFNGNVGIFEINNNDKEVIIQDSNILGNLLIDAVDGMRILNTTGNNLTIVNGDYFIAEDITFNNVNVNNPVGFTQFFGNSNIANDLTLNSVSINFGGYDVTGSTKAVLYDNQSVNVGGTLKATAYDSIGFSGDIYANKMEFTSTRSSLIQAVSDDVQGHLYTDEITINAPKGIVASLDANVSGGSSDYYEAMQWYYIPDGRGADSFGALDISTRTPGNTTLVINDGGGVANIAVDDNITDVIVTNNGLNDIMDLKLTAENADIVVSDLVAMKDTNESVANGTIDKTGNVVIETTNGSVQIGGVHAQTDLIVLAENGTITQTGALAADYDSYTPQTHENGVGSLILKADHDLDIDTTTYGALTGANIELSVNTGDIVTGNLEAVGFNYNPTTDKDATPDGLTKGDIIITTGDGKIELDNVHGTHDVILTATETVTLNDVVADADVAGVTKETELNGRGDLRVTAKDDVVGNNIGGANVYVTTDADITVQDVISHRNFPADDASQPAKAGNVVLTSNDGSISAGDVYAATNIEIYAQDGIFTQTGDLMADYNHPGNGHDSMVGDDRFDNGIGDLIIRTSQGENGILVLGGTALGEVTGANIDVAVATGDIVAEGLTAMGYQDSTVGNVNGDITITTPNGDLIVTNTEALRDITLSAADGANLDNGHITLSSVHADSDINGQGSLNVYGNDSIVATDISGANVTVVTTEGNIKVSGADSYRNPDDVDNKNTGNIFVQTPDGNITIGGVYGETDVTIIADNGNIYQTGDLMADYNHPSTQSDRDATGRGDYVTDPRFDNGIGDLNIKSNGDLDLGGTHGAVTGGSINVETPGNVTGDGFVANGYKDPADIDYYHDNHNGDITVTAGGTIDLINSEALKDVTLVADGDVTIDNVTADFDNNGQGAINITSGGAVTATDSSGSSVIINADNDVTAQGITASGYKDPSEGFYEDNHEGDIIITAGGDIDITDSTALKDVTLTADGSIDVNNVTADDDNNTQGALNVHAGDDVTVDNASGSDVTIITDNGNATVTDTHANGYDNMGDPADNLEALDGDGNFNGTGDLTVIATKGDITIDDVTAVHDVSVTVGGNLDIGNLSTDRTNPNFPADSDHDTYGDFIINKLNDDTTGTGNDPFIDDLSDEVVKVLNNLEQSGVETQIAQSFTPIAFAADDDDENLGAKRIAKIVFKTPETGIVTITDVVKSAK